MLRPIKMPMRVSKSSATAWHGTEIGFLQGKQYVNFR